jgi:hypothetical protein
VWQLLENPMYTKTMRNSIADPPFLACSSRQDNAVFLDGIDDGSFYRARQQTSIDYGDSDWPPGS